MKYVDGSVYTRLLMAEKRHGTGIYVATDGTIYDGKWKEVKKHGEITVRYSNGDEFEEE